MNGDVLWSPPADWAETSEIGRYLRWLSRHRNLTLDGYEEAHRWSVNDVEGFWGSVAEFFAVKFHSPPQRVLADPAMPGAQWFPGATLNYAEHLVGQSESLDRVAVIGRSQTRPPVELTYAQLRDQVARARVGLQRLGVGRGDRVVAYAPNIPETLVAFIATASLGAIWASCAAEFGTRSVIDRLSQIEPKVMITVPGYGYRDRYVSREREVSTVRAGLPTLQHVVSVPYGPGEPPSDALLWDELIAQDGPLEFEPVPFDHPLYVLFSSGTTGLPKPIVHGHGGQLIEHFKTLSLSWDLKPGERLLWFSTTAWMMWNMLVAALLCQTSIVMLDGDPTWPNLMEQWRLADELGVTVMGASPVYLMACRRAGLLPGRELGLDALRALMTAGSPFPAEGYRWVYEHLDPKILFVNGSGGTDICSGILGGSFAQPVYEGELTAPYLGLDVHAYDPDGKDVPIGEFGELVITQPIPSMPVGFWGDEDGSRYHDSYFAVYPGVWRQGDWLSFTEHGSSVLAGRSDATLNRGGVRLGTGEFYAVLEDVPEVADSLVVHLEAPDGGAGQLLLFVALTDGRPMDDELRKRISHALRSELSPRHVPDQIIAVTGIPRTLTGKKLETPVKRILRGEPVDAVASRGSLSDPSVLDQFVGIV